jgi:DNA invertase Pin-like site-specific DNA recombinase
MTKGMLMMWGVFSEMERDIISQRVKSGMQNAAAKGKRIGRPKTTAETIPDKFWKYHAMYKSGNITVSEFARLMDCSRTTIYKYMEMTKK